jgi:hypothetical protein
MITVIEAYPDENASTLHRLNDRSEFRSPASRRFLNQHMFPSGNRRQGDVSQSIMRRTDDDDIYIPPRHYRSPIRRGLYPHSRAGQGLGAFWHCVSTCY